MTTDTNSIKHPSELRPGDVIRLQNTGGGRAPRMTEYVVTAVKVGAKYTTLSVRSPVMTNLKTGRPIPRTAPRTRRLPNHGWLSSIHVLRQGDPT